MKKLLLAWAFLLLVFDTQAQSVTLEDCLNATKQQFPLLKQRPAIEASTVLALEQYRRAYLPLLNVQGQVSYQSDVPSFPFTLPGVPGLVIPNTQYRAFVEAYQPIYDGGLSRAQRLLALESQSLDLQKLTIASDKIKFQVAQLYVQVLMLENQRDIALRTIALLEQKEELVKAGVAMGVASSVDAMKMSAALLEAEGQHEQIEHAISAGRESLSLFTGMDLTKTVLEKPQVAEVATSSVQANSSVALYRSQRNALLANESLLKTARMPRVNAFAQAGIGAPNPYNFFEANLSPFYIAGLRANWQLWDWGKVSGQRKTLHYQMDMLTAAEEQEVQRLSAEHIQLQWESARFKSAIDRDSQMLALRKQIRERTEAQFAHGTITSSDLLEEVLKEQQAAIQLSVDQMNHQLAQIKLSFNVGLNH
jgi:outer membrane protein TolC